MNLKKIFKILNPQSKIGALKINDVDLKFSRIDGDKIFSCSVKLAVDIVQGGKIKNKEGFLSALSTLHSQIVDKDKKKINIIVNIPDNDVYFQVFNLPALESNLEEAVNLNLKMISPIDFSGAYSDWQMIGEEIVDGRNQMEILGAFSEAKLIDEFDECLRAKNFIPVVFEFNSLALSRLAVDFGANVDKNKPFLLLNVDHNGLNFGLVRNGNLHFSHFVSWQAVSSEMREISFDVFKKIIVDEIKKVLSFYEIQWKEQVAELILVNYGLNEVIVKIVSENFSFIKIQPLSLKKISGDFGEISPEDVRQSWFSVLGSAIRGTILRSKDTIISLAKVGTEEEFFQHQKIGFIKFWRNAAAAVMAVILVVFVSADFFLTKSIASLNSQIAGFSSYEQFGKKEEFKEFARLKKEIENYNKKIDLAVQFYNERSKWSEFFTKISDLAANNGVSIRRIYIQSVDMPVLINALALNEDAVVNFKNKIISDTEFKEVDLPITKISRTEKGVEFTINFKIKQ